MNYNQGKSADLAIPAELAKQKFLDSCKWKITQVSLIPNTIDSGHRNILFRAVAGLPKLSATLIPLDSSALRDLDEINGRCFFALNHLFRICDVSLSIDTCEGVQVFIDAQAIWHQEPKPDLNKSLPIIQKKLTL